MVNHTLCCWSSMTSRRAVASQDVLTICSCTEHNQRHVATSLQDAYSAQAEIVGLEWYKGQEGYCEPGCAVLAICLRTGQLQLMKDEMDDTCLVISTGMQASNIKWNSDGSVLAVSGVINNSTGPGGAVVQFYSCNGKALHSMHDVVVLCY